MQKNLFDMDNQNEKQFVTGFNHGYLLAKYLPELLVKLIKSLKPANEYFQGFFSGSKEYELEVSRNELADLKQIRDKSRDRKRNVERDL